MDDSVCVFIGRFQPFHVAHYAVVRDALAKYQTVCLIIGSAQESGTLKNPWGALFREIMISGCFTDAELERIKVERAIDCPGGNEEWASQVMSRVAPFAGDLTGPQERRIVLTGYKKDESSFYLDLFPAWEFIPHEPGELGVISATDIRYNFFKGEVTERWAKHLPPAVGNKQSVQWWMERWRAISHDTYFTLRAEVEREHAKSITR